MPGTTLNIGSTNPKKGAVQYDGRRIDGVPFIIPIGAGVSSAPIGSVCSLQEFPSIGMKIVLGPNAYVDGSGNTYSIIGMGFLEAATQTDGNINQTVGEYLSGDMAAIIMDVNAVAAVPMLSGFNPVSGVTAYVDVAGRLTSTAYGNEAFKGIVCFTTPGYQVTGQLKSGYCFARLLVGV